MPRADVGEAAAVVLTTAGHEEKAYAIAAETAYSFEDIAEMLSEISGKEVKYLRPDLNTYIERSSIMAYRKIALCFLVVSVLR